MSSQSFIYLIEAENGLVKIGRGQKVGDRVAAVRLHSPVKARLLAVWPGGIAEEETLHQHFVAYRSHGEWFCLEGGLKAFVASQRGLNVSHIPEWADLSFERRGEYQKQKVALARVLGSPQVDACRNRRLAKERSSAVTGLTPRQSTLLRFISWFSDEHGCTPSYQEIIDELGLASKSAAHRMVGLLSERGYVERSARLARTLILTDAGRAHLRSRPYAPAFKSRPYLAENSGAAA